MSDASNEKPKDAAAPAAAAPKSRAGGPPLILGLVLPALIAGGAAYGGTRAAGKLPAATPEESAVHQVDLKPPGPTIALEPFLVSVTDEAGKAHPMKLSVAVEFSSAAKEETLRPYVPRIRDAILAHMRTLSYEDAVSSQHSDKLRGELLERCQKVGALAAERILITDLVSQ